MKETRKKQIAWWAQKVYDQAQEYADVVDPRRQRRNRTANKLDAIAGLCKRIHFELTRKLPNEKHPIDVIIEKGVDTAKAPE